MKSSPKSSVGIALVIVLCFLVLISVIVVGFMSSVSNELTQSKAAATSATTQQLANSAVNVVMAQIVDATKGQNSDSTLAWASQPGMIRSFDDSGKPGNFYKLYSSDAMTVAGQSFDIAKEVPPSDWNSVKNSDLYTDLNAPVELSTGDLVYPIVNPAADGTAPPGRPNEKFKVDGFSLSLPTPGFTPDNTESTLNNRAPMPVKWLYLLKDGTLKAATDADGDSATVNGATASNPIVGRIAFWADDETAKVNINTASEGTYWDVPRVYSNEDFGRSSGSTIVVPGMSICQPAQREYQRYPGHPATTCLSSIFGSVAAGTSAILPVPSPFGPFTALTAAQTAAAKLDPYYAIAPRIGLKTGGSGGSRGGSVQVVNTAAVPVLDTDRLYASVDELMFSPTLTTGTDPARIPNTATNSAVPKTITKGVLEKARFFVTANSTAPETTLYNTPRIAVWPVWDAPAKRTAYDSLLAFCSTIGSKPGVSEYYFTRANPRNGTTDYTARNKQLYEYLQALTKANVPGFGGNFLQKYPAGPEGILERDQILTYIYDYIRCTNLQDQSRLPNNTPVQPYTPLFTGGGVTVPAGEVVPIRVGQTQGFGRFYSITSANLLFYATRATSGKVDRMRAMFFLGFTTPMQGLACMRSNLKFKVVKGLESLRVQDKSLNFKFDGARGNGTNYMDTSDLSLYHGRSVGGTESPWQALKNKPFLDADAGGDAPNKYPFFSAQDVDVTGLTSLAFPASSEVVVEIRTKDTNYLIQTVRFSFPSGQFSVPRGQVGDGRYGSRTGGDFGNLVNSLDTLVALQVGGSDLSANASDPGDAIDLTGGDTRMTASLIDVSSNRFRADRNYKAPNVQFAHCLVQSVGASFTGAKYGKLANVATYQQVNLLRQPDVPSRVATGAMRKDGGPGDWDTGFGDQKDGAYINKPDEGDTALQDNTNGATRLPYSLGFGAGFASATNTYFSPNRQIPSPLMLGSIPTGVQRMLPWQTLLFHARPEDTSHPGFGIPRVPPAGQGFTVPPDHLIADLFWMPVVEPYAISQPLATAGKINLNYQIVPFTYINRSTGLHAVMKSTKFAALALSDSSLYKPIDAAGNSVAPTTPNRRQAINMDKTLEAFDTKFKNNEIFKSASQICEMNLVPNNETNASMATFWKTKFAFTGDNLREKPYVDIYPRLTTKSNTYTVHVRVQTLRKVPGTPTDRWIGTKDKVVGEYRGSSILERYIDLNDPTLPDFATLFAANPKDAALNIDQYYKMRVVSTKRFAP